MSRLTNFYLGQGTDVEGRRLAGLWEWDDDELEAVHDFIQWMFPLPERSAFNPDAPLLTDEDVAAFRSNALLQVHLRKSFERMLSFLGLAVENGQVVEGAHFAARAREVWARPNHNWLRATRILRSLRLLGLEAESLALYGWLEAVSSSGRFPIPADTFQYWTEAAKGCRFMPDALPAFRLRFGSARLGVGE